MVIKKQVLLFLVISLFSLFSYAQATITCGNLACTINYNSTTNETSNSLQPGGLVGNIIFSLPRHFWIIQPIGVTGNGEATSLGILILGTMFNGTSYIITNPTQIQFIAASSPDFHAAYNTLGNAIRFSPQDPQNSYNYIDSSTLTITDKNWNIAGSPATVVFTLIQAPEPTTWLFLGSCLGFLAILHRFRRDKALVK